MLFTLALLTVSCFALLETAQGADTKVIITNETSKHCIPYPSCYQPFQANIAVGDTVTWINHDNKTHTATTGTTNNGPIGVFDSGSILPGHSYTQFFGTVGKYQYYDKIDMWPSGVIFVSKIASYVHLAWVQNSLTVTKQNYTSNGVVITKQIQNTGNSDASSILFRLKIRNQSSFQFYDNIVKVNVPAQRIVPVTFSWNNPPDGKYNLFFDADAANVGGGVNTTNATSVELISIPTSPASQQPNIIQKNFTLDTTKIPEFGLTSYIILTISVVSIIIFSSRNMKIMKIRLFS